MNMSEAIITGSWIDVIHVNQKDGVYWNERRWPFPTRTGSVLWRT